MNKHDFGKIHFVPKRGFMEKCKKCGLMIVPFSEIYGIPECRGFELARIINGEVVKKEEKYNKKLENYA